MERGAGVEPIKTKAYDGVRNLDISLLAKTMYIIMGLFQYKTTTRCMLEADA
jgi:hypothetical protein